MTIFIAVIPQDYARAEVELFETNDEAQQFIRENAIRGETHYCSVLEREIIFKPTKSTREQVQP